MGFQALSILTEGIWASITGGWYYDKKQSHFSNLFHLYIWLIFLCLPFVNFIFVNTYLSWLLYCTFIGIIFTVIKLGNAYFHRIFDTGKCIKDDVASSELEPALNSQSGNDGESKDQFEMIVMPTSLQNSSAPNNDRVKYNNLEAVSTFTKVNKLTEECDEECINDEKEVRERIDCKADVHINDSDSSCANLSFLFKNDSSFEEEDANLVEDKGVSQQEQHSIQPMLTSNDLVKSVSNKSTLDIVSNSDTSLSNMTSIYTKANSSHNSIGVFDHIKYDKMSTFRRARSELETIKHSDKYSRPTLLVPPSHPVSMEVINAKNYNKPTDESAALDTSRFNKNSNIKLNPFESILNYGFVNKSTTNAPQTSKDSIDEFGGSSNLEKIEECQEKNPSHGPSATYIRACDSSEDGDESEISLCTKDIVKFKSLNNRKLSKQPLRKPRVVPPRKRSSKASSSSRGNHSDWGHKHDVEQGSKREGRSKPGSIVLLSTSDEEDDKDGTFPRNRCLNERFNSVSSDSSSFIPSSSSSSSVNLQKPKVELFDIDTDEATPLNYGASTSTGISRAYRKKLHKSKYSKRSFSLQLTEENKKFLLNEFIKLDGVVPSAHLKHIMSHVCRQMMQQNLDVRLALLFDACQPNKSQTLDYNFIKQLLYRKDSTAATDDKVSRRHQRDPSRNSLAPGSSPMPRLILDSEILTFPGTHIADSHEDTTSGAVHVFQDEKGNWFTYTFDENSTGVAKGLSALTPFSKMPSEADKFKSSALVPSNSLFYLNNLPSPPGQSAINALTPNSAGNEQCKDMVKLDMTHSTFGLGNSLQTPDSLTSNARNVFFDPMPTFDFHGSFPVFHLLDASTTSDFIASLNNHSLSHSYQRSQQQLKQSQYYEMNLLNCKTIKIRFDRLSLQAFLDRNLTTCELIFSIILAISVSVFSSILLYKSFFHDLTLVLFCLVVASSQYTLLKSVQPDAASPTHGFNRITIYSRPIYFCLGSIILLLSNEYLNNVSASNISFEIYGMNVFNRDFIYLIFYISRLFLLSFPILFTFGFLPQFNTFFMYIFEQVDIHVFGGTASTMGMISASYSLIRSFLVVGLLFLFGQVLNIKETQRASFSVFCGFLFAISYHMSRLPSDPSLYWNVFCSIASHIGNFFGRLIPSSSNSGAGTKGGGNAVSKEPAKSEVDVLTDPLPSKLKQITLTRLESDFIVCIFIAISVFGVHVSSIFKLQPFVNTYTTWLALYWGFFLHYLFCNSRKQLPWLCFASPILKSYEYKRFEVKGPAKNMWFEKLQAWLWLIEKNIVSPLFFLSIITHDCPLLIKNYGPNFGVFLLVLCAFKGIRSTFNDPSHNYVIITFTYLLFSYDFKDINGSKDNIFLLNLFIVSVVYFKINDFLLKLRFVITYVAPWQITWGSAFHAFAQPFSVPHSAMLLVQIFISSVLSSPLQPLLGSAIFLASYVRPIKFWERDYNTKRVDHSNTRLASQIDKAQIGSDDNNLNSIFYEHLTRSLQNSLYGDLMLGRWGDVSQGDCFVLASDNLNCLVHIIELGNGLVTFQVRGLEFRGTYCQQREVEAISESVSDDESCCCFEPGHLRNCLSINSAFNQRWLSWEVTHANYVLEGYSISENSASTILQPYDLRKALITYYVKSIIYYCISAKSFVKWLENEDLKESLSNLGQGFVDLDPTFNFNIDEDFDPLASGITRTNFKLIYKDWILFCIERCVEASQLEFVRKNEDFVISLSLGLSLLARRALGTASHHNSALMSVDFFLYGFHSLFKGDFRVVCSRDEWVFHDMDFLNKVIVPSVRMSLKLHQDQFTNYEEYESNQALYEAISEYQKSIVISHEADPIWRNAILSNVPSLLALRHVLDDGTDQYKVVMLNKRFLNFRVIKINRECVRGLWAGQQQELIFLRNRNPERGSIQNAKQVLRNIINSSCDQPIGYPIYVSPLTTSFAETSTPLCAILGPPLSLSMFKRAICGFFQKIRNRCSEVCSSGGSNDLVFANARLSKSESSDRGIDDNVCGKGTLISSHSQLHHKNARPFKKRSFPETRNEEEGPQGNSTLVNVSTTRNVLALQLNLLDPNAPANVASLIPATNKQAIAETSFSNAEQSKSVIVSEKSLVHTRGDAV